MDVIIEYGKRIMYGNQAQLKIEADEEILIKRQIFLDSIDDIFDIIEAHLSYENDTRGKLKKSIHKKMIFNNELLKRVDSLVTTLQLFSLSCFSVKSRKDIDTLKLGKHQCKQKLAKIIRYDRKKYKPFVDIMYYAMDGNRIAFPKRKQTKGELNPIFNGKNMNDVLGQLIGGQHVVDTNRKKYKANTKDLKQKYDNDLKKAKNLPRIQKVHLPEMDDLYKVFNIENQEFISRKQKTKENKKKLNIKNGFIKSGNYSWTFDDYQTVYLEIPCPCLILEDMFANDNKILVELPYPYNVKFRPYKKDVFWCQDEETRKKIIEVELKHIEKFYYLSLHNKSYKSIADPLDIDEAMERYHQHNDNNDYAPDVDKLHNNNNNNNNRNNDNKDDSKIANNSDCDADYKDPSMEDLDHADGKFNHSNNDDNKDPMTTDSGKKVNKRNISGNFDDDNKDGNINPTKKVHGRHGRHNHDNYCQHNVGKKGNDERRHSRNNSDKNDENLQEDIDMMDANETGSAKPTIPIVRHDNVYDADGDFVNMRRNSSDQDCDTYNRYKMDIINIK